MQLKDTFFSYSPVLFHIARLCITAILPLLRGAVRHRMDYCLVFSLFGSLELLTGTG